MASSFRTVKVVWDLFVPLYRHLTQASNDMSRSSSEKCMFKGMAKTMSSVDFVVNLGVMYDALEELACLSKDLQERNISLLRAHNLVKRQVRVFSSMVDYPGLRYKEAKAAIEEGTVVKKFRNVALTDNRKCVIHHGQLMRSLAANLEKRLMMFNSKNGSTDNLLSAMEVLDPSTWPPECPLTYGIEDVIFLSRLFNIDVDGARRGLNEYIDSVRQEGVNVKPSFRLRRLINALKTVVI